MLLEQIVKLFKRKKKIIKDYKIVSIYADPSDNLFIIPNSIKQMRGADGGIDAEMDDVKYLAYPYADELLENTLYNALEECHREEPKWTNGLTPMEQYLNVKGYAKAVKNKRNVCLFWNVADGYSVIPTKKIPKQGYVHQEGQKIHIGKVIIKGELAIAVKQALTQSTP